MTEFETYLENLAGHEDEKSKPVLDTRTRILVNSGIRLNWMGDYMANPAYQFKLINVPVENVFFSGTNPEWNKILIDECHASVKKFQELIEKNIDIRNKFLNEASFGGEPILLLGAGRHDLYSVFDGMHRLVGAVLKNRKTISAYVATNEQEHLPVCEAHVIYDLIRGFQRHARDEEGRRDLFHALRLLSRTYGNVIELLRERFNMTYVADTEVQIIIENVVKQAKPQSVPGIN